MPDARSPIRHHLVLYRRDLEQGRTRFSSLIVGLRGFNPVLAPIGRIQEFKAQRAAGTFRGYGYAVFDVVVTIIVSHALWIFAVIVPLIFATITYHEVVG